MICSRVSRIRWPDTISSLIRRSSVAIVRSLVTWPRSVPMSAVDQIASYAVAIPTIRSTAMPSFALSVTRSAIRLMSAQRPTL